MKEEIIKVFIVDDHPLVLEGLVSMLDRVNGIEVTGFFERSKELLARMNDELPDVLLLDINLPDINGLEVCQIVRRLYPSVKILAISNYNDTSFVKSVMRNGAVGYLLKNSSLVELKAGVRAAFNGSIYLTEEIQSQLIRESFVYGKEPDEDEPQH